MTGVGGGEGEHRQAENGRDVVPATAITAIIAIVILEEKTYIGQRRLSRCTSLSQLSYVPLDRCCMSACNLSICFVKMIVY